MSQLAVKTKPVSVLDLPEIDVRIPDAPPRPDLLTERRSFQRRCEAIAVELAESSMQERFAAYSRGAYTLRELTTAAALCPEMMPQLNGELEWIALQSADLD